MTFNYPAPARLLLLAMLLLVTTITVPAGEDAKPDKEKESSSNWPLFRGNSLAQGVATCTLPENPELLWKFRVKEGAFEGSAAFVDGVVDIADLDGTLFAHKLSNR